MTNLKTAKDAIKAELAHAKKGASYYQSLIVALEETLARLDNVSLAIDMPVKNAKAGKTVKHQRKKALDGRKAGNGAELPSTGKEFWMSLITDQPQSASDILNAAIQKFDFTPNKEQRKKLSQRQTFTINSLVKAKEIEDVGAGRDRRFFIKK